MIEDKIYSNYLAYSLCLKHDWQQVDTDNPNWKHGRGEPDKYIGRWAIYYLWKNIHILNYEEFLTEKTIDYGTHKYTNSPIKDWIGKNGDECPKYESVKHEGYYIPENKPKDWRINPVVVDNRQKKRTYNLFNLFKRKSKSPIQCKIIIK